MVPPPTAPTNSPLDVLIIGAGLGGLAAAISTTLAGHRVRIVEQARALGEVGAGIQVPPNSSRILSRWGLDASFTAASVTPACVRLRRYKNGDLLNTQPLNPYCADTYDHPYRNVHRADYHAMLVAKAQALGVEIVLASSVCAIDFDPRRPRVTFTNGKSLTADLVLAADGLKSTSRSLLLGRADPPHLTGDLAYRITIPAAQMRADPLLRPLTETPEINIWLGPDAHAVCYLLKGGELYNIVACCPDTLPADTAIAAATAEEALSVFAGWDERLTRLVALGDGFSKWRLQNSRGMKSWRHECGRFALLGDACHATLPYLASGAAMAIEDGAVLGELLARVKSAEELPEVLRVYEDMRKPRTERVVTGSTAQREVFHMHDGAEQTERDRVLREDAQEKVKGVFPNRWRDAEFQSWLWGYDVEVEVEKAWSAAFGAKAGDAEKGADIAAEEAKADSGVDV